ncbi:MAG: MBL fold hydrolase [Alphaproteobacteria bacterium]|nr:MBL fold hydrolase [Alphaproteobacteria bacterium]|tara:strand:- start:88598 stop:90292 length:1695 start_codon:yes stop_codon:yes gene_type:complete
MDQKKVKHTHSIDPQKLYFLPLGGSEEFGINLNLYAYKGKWLAIDIGIGFASHRYPGVDILVPDVRFIEERKDNLVGLVVTHAHEDHIGAVAHLWTRLGCPIYCTPFTAKVLENKFEDLQVEGYDIRLVQTNGKQHDIGPFNLEFAEVSHSIPQTAAVLIRTPVGNIVHSADWNMDPQPVIGNGTQEGPFKKLGDEGVLAYIGDSTNAQYDGRAGSESAVEDGLKNAFAAQKGRIIITQFASNIGRMQSVLRAAQACGRSVCVLGRSLLKMNEAARSVGYLKDLPAFVSEERAEHIPSDQIVYVVTGSQGESRAALARIARGDHPALDLRRGDSVIFSSKAIPGNEREINDVKSLIVACGAKIVDHASSKEVLHVSGHPYRDELKIMYEWTRPEIVIPVHGERVQLEAQADWARECKVPQVLVPINGALIEFGEQQARVIDHIPTGVLAVTPTGLIPGTHKSLTQRRKLQYEGVIFVSLVVDRRGHLAADPQLTTHGLIDPSFKKELEQVDELEDEVYDILADMSPDDRSDDAFIAEEVRIGIRKLASMTFRIRPRVFVHVSRV